MLGNKNYQNAIEWLALNQCPVDDMNLDRMNENTAVRLLAMQRRTAVHNVGNAVLHQREILRKVKLKGGDTDDDIFS